jgi:uncharacterized RDD family membrane protein YckC
MNVQQTPDLIEFETELVRASAGQRFANYLIDFVLFYCLFFVVGVIVIIIAPATLEVIETESLGFDLADRLITLLFYALYMGVVEALFKGKSLGKLITKTRAVTITGERISSATAFARGFSRAVPFCAFSAFGTPCDPWQDRWTNSMVIDEKMSNNQH